MPEIPPALIQRLRDTLARCPALDSDSALRDVFVDVRLAPWRNHILDNTSSRAARVNALIRTLHDKTNTAGDNALALLLHVLAEQIDPVDALHDELTNLAAQLAEDNPPGKVKEAAGKIWYWLAGVIGVLLVLGGMLLWGRIAPTPVPQLGDAWTRPADGMVMLYVPAGEFQMGSILEQTKEHLVNLSSRGRELVSRQGATTALAVRYLQANVVSVFVWWSKVARRPAASTVPAGHF